MRAYRPFLMVAVVLIFAGCQTLTEELPAQPTTPPVQIPVLPPPVVIPVDLPPPGAPAPPPGNPAPPPSGGGGVPGQWPTNTNPVVKVGAKVYFVECNGEIVPDSEYATSVQVGCRIHLDCTPKDQYNNPTQAKSAPQWTFNGGVSGGNPNDFTPTVSATSAGNFTAWVVVDGVTSNSVNVSLYN